MARGRRGVGRIRGYLLVLGAALAVTGGLLWRPALTSRANGAAAGDPLRIGYAVEAPYAFVDARGRVTGADVELARAVAARLGIRRVVWRQVEFGSLIGELTSGAVDVVAAGMFITPERLDRVAFSRPIAVVGAALLVRAGNPLRLHSYEDAASRGARIAVLAGSVEEAIFLSLPAPRLARPVVVPDAAAGAEALAAGEVDGLALSAPSLRWLARTMGDAGLVLAEPFHQPRSRFGPQAAGFAFRVDDRSRIAAWNRELSAFLGSPTHLALVQPIGFTGEETSLAALEAPPFRAGNDP